MYVPAWMLILVAMFVIWLVSKRDRAPAFAPYRVTIAFEWRALLDDHLDMTPERYKDAEEWQRANPEEPGQMFTVGLTFTALTPIRGGRLTYFNRSHVFQSRVSWTEPIPGVFWPQSELDRKFRSPGPQPRIRVSECTDAYELAIEVAAAEMLHPARRADAKECHHAVDGDADLRLIVARLPFAALDSPRDERTIRTLAQHGWSAPVFFEPDVFGAGRIEIKHRHARVRFRHI